MNLNLKFFVSYIQIDIETKQQNNSQRKKKKTKEKSNHRVFIYLIGKETNFFSFFSSILSLSLSLVLSFFCFLIRAQQQQQNDNENNNQLINDDRLLTIKERKPNQKKERERTRCFRQGKEEKKKRVNL